MHWRVCVLMCVCRCLDLQQAENMRRVSGISCRVPFPSHGRCPSGREGRGREREKYRQRDSVGEKEMEEKIGREREGGGRLFEALNSCVCMCVCVWQHLIA